MYMMTALQGSGKLMYYYDNWPKSLNLSVAVIDDYI